ncbi:ABC transporter permease, partial [Streptomyces sp. NPDC005266]
MFAAPALAAAALLPVSATLGAVLGALLLAAVRPSRRPCRLADSGSRGYARAIAVAGARGRAAPPIDAGVVPVAVVVPPTGLA